MARHSLIAVIASLMLAGCNSGAQQSKAPEIKVRSAEQDQLHTLDAFNLAVGLKRAIYDAGYTCQRVTDAGFVGTWKNLDMWMAHCEYPKGKPRDWAIFAGPDGSAQVRDCKDIPGSGLPDCVIKQRPKGSFTDVK
jgi:outer membrane murein-binding lipoprotein Lpp